ncbi:MAG: hypothetical protein CSA22_05525 [Deltaproteobacteria bacterium]|nr:MAG: hypothetical protein CSA22_05525 [Deltaproteobacteria bacterium]
MKMLENTYAKGCLRLITSCIGIVSLLFFISCTKGDDSKESTVVTRTVKVQKKIPINDPSQPENKEKKETFKDKNKDVSEIRNTGSATSVANHDDVSSIKEKLLSSVIQSEASLNDIVTTDASIQQYYLPDGKLDPFKSIFFESEISGEDKFKPKKNKRKHITPLEKFDLGQLELVGIIQSEQETIGIVEESNGKGYVVRLGTYIGLNSGRIVEISNDRLLIEEEVVNPLGKTKVIQREIKLQKPVGE